MRWAYRAAVAGVVGIVATLVAGIWWTIDYRVAANVSLVYMVALTTVFAGLYLARSKWWTNRIGRIYLVKSLVLALVLAQIVAAVWWDTDYPFRQHIRFVIYSLGAVVYVPMIVSLLREQRRDRRLRGVSRSR